MIKILFIGDIIGRPGRNAVKTFLPGLKEQQGIDFVIANGENVAGGKGITPGVAEELFVAGVNVITGGNHTWANKEVYKIIDEEPRLLRPANYPEDVGVPGRGWGIYRTKNGDKIGVLNLVGRIFLGNYDSPFAVALKKIEKIRSETPLIIVDFHAEATSEKVAMGWFLDGEVTAVIGTHTHVATADERVSARHTAYITDVGMTGPFDSVIGVKKDIIIEHFQKLLPVRHTIANGDVRLCGVIIEADPLSGYAVSIERITRRLE